MDITTIGALLGAGAVVYGLYKGIQSTHGKKGEKFRNDYTVINSLSELNEISKDKYILLVVSDRVKKPFKTVRRSFENDFLVKLVAIDNDRKIPICWTNPKDPTENDIDKWLDTKTYGKRGAYIIKNGSVVTFKRYSSMDDNQVMIDNVKKMFESIQDAQNYQ